MSTIQNPAIPKGSTVLVTGANGLIASHVVDQFLENGYKVRGTVRDPVKSAWLTALFDKKYGNGAFELVQVADMAVENAYDEVVKGTSAVVHTTTILSMDKNPNNVIPGAISGALNAAKAAYSEPSVKRFVFTSSSSATGLPQPNVMGVVIKKDTWNEASVKMAWSDNPGEWGLESVYPASKTQAEQAVWKFYSENKDRRPDIVVNTVLPNLVLGKSLDPVNQGHPSSSMLPAALFAGLQVPQFKFFPAQFYVDVQDIGRLHVAGAIHPDVESERIFGFAGPMNWDTILDILRRHYPDRTFPENFNSDIDYSVVEERPRAEQLLRDFGRPGWTSLEDSVLMNTEDLSTTSQEDLMRGFQRVLDSVKPVES